MTNPFKKFQHWFRQMEDKHPVLGKHVRPTLFAIIPMLMFGYWSVHLAVLDQPEWFARLGGLMIAWAIFNIARARAGYAVFLEQLERNRFTSHLNQLREFDELREERLNLTFDLYGSQIGQLSQAIGKKSYFYDGDDISLKAKCLDIERRLDESDALERYEAAIGTLKRAEKTYNKDTVYYSWWNTYFFKLEVALLIWGTLQSSYGEVLVESIHNGTVSIFLNEVWNTLNRPLVP